VAEALEQRTLLSATHLAFSSQPVNTVAGQSIQQFSVSVLDEADAVVTTDNSLIVFSISTGPEGSENTLFFALPAVNGVASVTGLTLTTAGNYSLEASDGALTATVSNVFAITPDAADHLRITMQPGSTVAGHTLADLVVEVQDQFGNVVDTDTSNITVALGEGSATLGGTATQAAVNGVATFNDLSLTKAGSYSLAASDASLTADSSTLFDITPDAAAQLTFSQQPTDVTAGHTLSSVQVRVEDQFGNLISDDSSNVTLSIASGSGTLDGTLTVAADHGLATFDTLSLNQAGAFTLGAADASLEGGTSDSFNVNADAATHLAFSQGPANGTAGALGTITVTIQDQFNNVVTSDNSNVTIALGSGSGTLSGTLTVAAVNGVATFTDLGLTKADTYTLTASDGEFSPITSESFTLGADVASQLVISQQPGNTVAGETLGAVVVQVQDQYGNVVVSDSSNVTIAIASGSATLGGTLTVAAVNGVATFNTLSFTETGAYTLGVTDGDLAGATSESFQITPAAASQLVFTQQPGNASVGSLGTITVAVEDAFGNIISTDNSNVTIAIASGSGTLLGTATVAAVNGVATFSSLAIHEAGDFTLAVTDGSLTGATSSSFTLAPTSATHLVFTQQPTSMVAGNLLTGINASVEDQFGNVVTSNSSNITFTVTGGGNTLNFVVQAVNGVAVLNSIFLVKAGDYSVKATSSGLTQATSNTITVTPATASKVVITTQPTTTTAGNTLSAVVAKVEDQFGNVVTTDNSNVTIALASGSGTLNGTLTVAAVNGVATFSDLSLNQSGVFTLGISDGGLTGATSSNLTINPAAAAQLLFTTQPVTTVAGVTLSNVVVTVEDAFGNVVTSDNSNVTIALASGEGALGNTLTVAAVNGVATFSDLVLTTAGEYTLAATDGSLASATSSGFSITPAAASKLAFLAGPANGAAGSLGTLTVAMEDAFGNLVTSDVSDVTLAITSGTGTLLGTTTVAAVNGIATFSDLQIQSPDIFQLTASDGSLTDAVSSNFTITPAAPSQLVITSQPGDNIAGEILSTIVVKVEDQFGNVVTSDNSTITLNLASGSATLNGTLEAAAINGVATFSNLSLTKTGAYTIGASDGELAGATSASFTISADVPAQVAFSVQPTTTTAGQTIASLTVSVEDQFGNLITGDTSSITLSIATGTGTLQGTTTVAAVGGVATFGDLVIDEAGAFTLHAADGPLAAADSESFTINPDVATHVVITTEPGDATAGQAISTIVAKVEDQFDNVVTTDNSNISISISSGTGTLNGTLIVAAESGVASFSGLSINNAGSFVLSISDGSLTGDDSSSFTIGAAAASKLVITQGPVTTIAGQTLPSILVQVEDEFGNVVTTDSSNVTVSLASGEAEVNGTLTAAAGSGIATFSDLMLTQAGSYTMNFTDGELSAALSEGFDITPDVASKLAFVDGPVGGPAGSLGTLTVAVQDQFGNTVTSDNSAVTIDINTGSGSLLGTATVNAVNGIATFSDLAIQTPDTYTLSASDGALANGLSDAFAITPAVATTLAITSQPTDTVAGQTISSIVVEIRDPFGNVVTSANSNITIAIANGNGTLAGTLTVAAVNGIATFSDLSLTTAGAVSLVVSGTELSTATSSTFNITPAAPTQLAFTTQPAESTVAGQTLASIVVSVEDQYGNLVTTDSSNVTIALASGSATLNGTVTVAAVNGVATFSDLMLTAAGNYTFGATDGSLAGTSSSTFAITPDAASVLVYHQGPANGAAGNLGTISVYVEDQFGNLVITDSSTVTLSLNAGSLLGTVSQAASGGIATFGNLAIHTKGTYTLTAADGALTGVTSPSFTISAAAASQLVFTQQPVNTVAGAQLAPIAVSVEDQFGNVVDTDSSNVSLSINTGANTITLIVAASSGVATFNGFTLTRTGSYNFRATDGALPAANSSSFNITPDVASQVVFTQQPSNGAAGTLNPIVVSVEDQYGNIAVADNSNITLTIASGTGALLGTTTVAAVNGIATFDAVEIHVPGTFTLGAADGGLAGATSTSFTISAAAASQMVISTQPVDGVAGQTLSNVVITLEDAYGNVATGSNANVTLAVQSGPDTLGGTLTVAAVNGVATFSNVSLNKAGSYTLAASASGLGNAVTDSFAITPAAASQIVISTQPTNTTAGQVISSVVIQVEDAFGNVVTTDNSDITIALTTDTAVLSGTLTVQAVNGVATFSDLSMTRAGSYMLHATDDSFTVNSGEFAVLAAVPSQLVITQQPADASATTAMSAIVVEVQDQFGNKVSTDSSNVTIAIASGTGTLSGTTTVAAVNGVATFNDLSIDNVGAYTLSVSDGELQADVSDSFNVTANVPHHLVFIQQPGTGANGALGTVIVQVVDVNGNLVADANSNVTIDISSGNLGGTKTVAAVNGVATFTDLSMNKNGSFTLTATDGALGSATSAAFTFGAKLVFQAQPTTTIAGETINQIRVLVEDAGGHLLTGDNSAVTLSIASGPDATLMGTVTVNAVNGVATFDDIILQTAGTYKLSATDGTLKSATSGNFNINPDAPTQMTFLRDASDVVAGAKMTSIRVQLQDQFGNLATNYKSAVTLTVADGPGAITGDTSVNVSNGIATFNSVSLRTAGTYTLHLATGGLDLDTSSITVVAAAARALAFSQLPTATTVNTSISPAIVVDVVDNFGNVIAGSTVNITLSSNGGKNALAGTKTVAAVGGHATFSDVKLTKTGSFKIKASAQGLRSVTASAIVIS
jgi:hypothetical protein